jgi:hypothetical protein
MKRSDFIKGNFEEVEIEQQATPEPEPVQAATAPHPFVSGTANYVYYGVGGGGGGGSAGGASASTVFRGATVGTNVSGSYVQIGHVSDVVTPRQQPAFRLMYENTRNGDVQLRNSESITSTISAESRNEAFDIVNQNFRSVSTNQEPTPPPIEQSANNSGWIGRKLASTSKNVTSFAMKYFVSPVVGWMKK